MTDYVTVEEGVEIVLNAGHVLADPGLFVSALTRPQMSLFGDDAYPDVWSKAAAMLESLARNHTLVDGNKRTAARLTFLFLALNGWDVTPGRAVEDFVVDVAQGHVPLAESAVWLREHATPA